MSLPNRKEEKRKYKEYKVTKDLFRRNPAIIDHFCAWYIDYQKEYSTLPINVNNFFDLNFKWTIWVWWDYFYNCGIDIAIGENKIYVFYNDREGSAWPNLSGRIEIFYIDSDDDPSSRFETAVAELICRIELPF